MTIAGIEHYDPNATSYAALMNRIKSSGADAVVLASILEENGAEKVIPGAETLETAWRRARMRLAVNKKIGEIQASLRGDANAETVPGDLAAQLLGVEERARVAEAGGHDHFSR